MRLRTTLIATTLLLSSCSSIQTARSKGDSSVLAWKRLAKQGFTLFYTEVDQRKVVPLLPMVIAARQKVEAFFGARFPASFEIFVYPDRKTLTESWRQAWSMPKLQSQCWMVASGNARGMKVLSPRTWATEACEHDASKSRRVAALLTHELVHVFHAQHLADKSFDGMDDVGWFVEGLATHVSGQLELGYLAPASKALIEGKVPTKLRKAWSGKYKYGVCGSLVAYVHRRVGRRVLLSMLRLKSERELLQTIGLGEEQLLDGWRRSLGEC